MSATIPSRSNGQTIDATWYNILKSAFDDVKIVPSFVDANATLGASYNFALVDSSTGNVDLTLPSAINNEGRFYVIKILDLTNDVTLLPDGSETIDGASSYVFSSLNDCVRVDSDGSNWNITTKFGSVIAQTVSGCSVESPTRLDVKKDTYSNLETYATTASNGQLCFATDTKEAYQIVDGFLVAVGGGGGSGDSDTISLIVSNELSDLTSFDLSGNNASFDGGGSLSGAISLSTTGADLILSGKAIKYVAGAGSSANDYFGKTYDVPQGFRGRDLGFTFEYKNDSTVNNNDFRFCVKIKDGAQAGYIYYDNLETGYLADNTAKRFSNGYFIPTDCTQVEAGWQNTDSTGSIVLIVDNILFTANPFTYKNLISAQMLRLDTASGYGSTNNKIRTFSNITDSIGGGFFSYSTSGTEGASFTILKDCSVTISYVDQFNYSGYYGISKNSSELTTTIDTITQANKLTQSTTSAANYSGMVGWSGTVRAGDILRPHTQGLAGGATPARTLFTITAIGESEHVVTPAKSTLSDWTAYTPTITGFGTPTAVTAYYKQIGDSYHIRGKFTSGTSTAVEARFSLPNGAISSADISGVEYAGPAAVSFASTAAYNMSRQASVDYLTFGAQSGTFGGITKLNASVILSSGLTLSFEAVVPITGLSGLAQLLAAIPTPKVCYLKDVKAYNVDGGTSSTGHNVRTLNVINETGSNTTGSCSFVTLAASKFTIQPGKYHIKGKTESFSGSTQRAFAYIRDDSAGANDVYAGLQGLTEHGSPTVSPTVEGIIELSSPKTFEFKEYTSSGASTDGLGVAHDLSGYDNVYSVVEITKIK